MQDSYSDSYEDQSRVSDKDSGDENDIGPNGDRHQIDLWFQKMNIPFEMETEKITYDEDEYVERLQQLYSSVVVLHKQLTKDKSFEKFYNSMYEKERIGWKPLSSSDLNKYEKYANHYSKLRWLKSSLKYHVVLMAPTLSKVVYNGRVKSARRLALETRDLIKHLSFPMKSVRLILQNQRNRIDPY